MTGTAMKAVVLLAVLLCFKGAWAIKCHSCNNAISGTCRNETECPAGSQFCVSLTGTIKIQDTEQATAVKYCATTCAEIPVQPRSNLLEGEMSFYCCDTDLCNGAGTGASATGLMLVTGVLTTFLGTWL
ncbi:lymphocyte antigen 6D-like [Tamandua tetradactyla]|uniref:lymphocyte antigen 6D-like n=1 Tax=Tamandua tetradactyla TaxID=48850 RepID=UPI004053BEBE